MTVKIEKWILIIIAVSAIQLNLAADDWPGWRGHTGDSVYRDDDWDYSKLGSDYLWSIDIGQGYSAPSISQGKLLAWGFYGGKDTLFCFDPDSGREQWRFSYNSIAGRYPGPLSSPVIDGDRVYILSRVGLLLCIDMVNGRELWRKDLIAEMNIRLPAWHHSGSPVVRGDILYLNVNRNGAALNKYDGSEIWSSAQGVSGYASPVFYSRDGEERMAVFGESKVYGVDLADGSVEWDYNWTNRMRINAADPLFIDGKVLVSASDKGAVMLDPSGLRVRKVWESREIGSHFSSFVEYEGRLYGNSGTAMRTFNAVTLCFDPDSGKVLWKERNGFGSLILAGDKLIMLNESGKIMIAEAIDSGYEELVTANAPHGQYWTAPVMANGLLYVRSSQGTLSCYDLRK